MSRRYSLFEAEIGIIPIQIRPDLVVRIHGIPFDLTPQEADKIARCVLALATSTKDEP